MSRVGNLPISIPKGVEVNIQQATVKVKGPKGELEVPIHQDLSIKQEDGEIKLSRQSNNRSDRAQHGLARSLINNAIIGTFQGYSRNLEIHGVGYRCAFVHPKDKKPQNTGMTPGRGGAIDAASGQLTVRQADHGSYSSDYQSSSAACALWRAAPPPWPRYSRMLLPQRTQVCALPRNSMRRAPKRTGCGRRLVI